MALVARYLKEAVAQRLWRERKGLNFLSFVVGKEKRKDAVSKVREIDDVTMGSMRRSLTLRGHECWAGGVVCE
jgi:hypothetical protein